MKNQFILPVILFFLAGLIPAAGQIESPTPDEITNRIYNYSYPSDEKEAKYLTIRGEELDDLAGRHPEEYKNLEAVIIEFTENPEAPDSIKEKLIADIEKKLPNLACLLKCSRLKYIIFNVGEFLFIRSTDNIKYNSGDNSLDQEAARLNLERLNMRYGKKIKKIVPGIKIFAHNWGW